MYLLVDYRNLGKYIQGIYRDMCRRFIEVLSQCLKGTSGGYIKTDYRVFTRCVPG